MGTDVTGRRTLTHPEAATITAEELARRARAMVPLLRERAAATEAARRLLPETLQDFLQAGFFRIVQPRRFGGFELGMDALQGVLVEVARGCPSSAWTLGILAGHAWWVAQLPEDGQAEIFGDDGVALLPTGIFSRGGSARRVEGGYRFSGSWPYQSGCDVANWFGCGAAVASDDGGPPTTMLFVIPAAEGRIADDWHVMGMKGTGSKTVVVDDVFVPDRRTLSFADVEAQSTPGSRVHENPFYGLPLLAFISIEVTGAAVGAALGAVEALEELGRTKPIRARGGGGGETASMEMSRPSFRRHLAEAKTLSETAKTMLLAESKRLMEAATALKAAGRKMTREEIGEFTLHEANVIDLCVRAVKHCFVAAGTSATVQGHPIERALRDVFMISTHTVFRMDNAAEAWAAAHYEAAQQP